MPNWPIERLKREKGGALHPADVPFALIGGEERGLVLTAINEAAGRASLYPGLGLADARAICPKLLTAPAEQDKDAASLAHLAAWSSRFSPILNTEGLDGLWLDAAGIPHLFGGEQRLLADMARRFARLGFTTRLALAETLSGAHALARYGRNPLIVVPPGKIAAALAPLPVEGLRLADDTTRLLRRLGLKRIGQLYDLPRASLEQRFHSRDKTEAVLERLDQALGRHDEPRTPLQPPVDFAVRLPFPEPLITHDGVVAGLDHLAHELCGKLAAARRGARRLLLSIYRADGTTAAVEAGLSAPSHEAPHLLSLLQDKIAAIDAGFGVDLMALAADKTDPLLPAQSSFARGEDRARQEPLIDRLANRLTPRAVLRLFPCDSHMPERAQVSRSAFKAVPSWSRHGAPTPRRPPLLLTEPEPLAVLAQVPEGPPARFTWRRVTRRVVKAEGPERIAPEWWRGLARGGAPASSPIQSSPSTMPNLYTSRTRDYYRIEDDAGHRYWVFRDGLYQDADGTPSWYLHGVFG